MAFARTTAAATATAIATSAACGGPKQYELPVHDAACGAPNIGNYEAIFSNCAKPAGVLPYHNDCALYALAVGHPIEDLADCLYKAGVAWEDVWCTGATNATATATSYPTPTRTSFSTSNSTSKESSGSSTPSSEAVNSARIGAVSVVYKGSLRVKSALALVGFVLFAVLV
ncbi:hypothetical protein GX50_01175 [[Emmonsia] crescens]|uniref:Uncharacterized protein n=1 Tax=[Emmonsia] crescens TaxID=73230 RepID=A0A2B7ZQR7_9EURO|nr:hypothetical protein GX50_01175 [Emmonsia crescens]